MSKLPVGFSAALVILFCIFSFACAPTERESVRGTDGKKDQQPDQQDPLQKPNASIPQLSEGFSKHASFFVRHEQTSLIKKNCIEQKCRIHLSGKNAFGKEEAFVVLATEAFWDVISSQFTTDNRKVNVYVQEFNQQNYLVGIDNQKLFFMHNRKNPGLISGPWKVKKITLAHDQKSYVFEMLAKSGVKRNWEVSADIAEKLFSEDEDLAEIKGELGLLLLGNQVTGLVVTNRRKALVDMSTQL